VAELNFNRDLEGEPGEVVSLSPLVRRVLAPNPGPFTFRGTCTYVVGRGNVAVIDPGPADQAHLDALLKATKDETVSHIVLTHTHRDHFPLSIPLAEATGAPIVGCPPPRAPLDPPEGAAPLPAYEPDRVLAHGESVHGEGFTLQAVATPGHASNHLCFSLAEEPGTLFSGDHVMAWSTSVVIPPDGDMAEYLASLRLLLERDDTIYWPGHGGPVREPKRFVRALLQHRRQREAAILKALGPTPRAIDEIVPEIYQKLPPALFEPAAQSTLAHLQALVRRGEVKAEDGNPLRGARYRLG